MKESLAAHSENVENALSKHRNVFDRFLLTSWSELCWHQVLRSVHTFKSNLYFCRTPSAHPGLFFFILKSLCKKFASACCGLFGELQLM